MMEDERMRWHQKLTEIIYVLYALSLLVGITGIVAIVMNYIKRQDVKGTYLESHFRWQIRTFWFTLRHLSRELCLLIKSLHKHLPQFV